MQIGRCQVLDAPFSRWIPLARRSIQIRGISGNGSSPETELTISQSVSQGVDNIIVSLSLSLSYYNKVHMCKLLKSRLAQREEEEDDVKMVPFFSDNWQYECRQGLGGTEGGGSGQDDYYYAQLRGVDKITFALIMAIEPQAYNYRPVHRLNSSSSSKPPYLLILLLLLLLV